MTANFEQGFVGIGELPTEDLAGIGFGLSTLLLVSLIAARFVKNRGAVEGEAALRSSIPRAFCGFVLIAPWIALLAYGMKSGMVTPQRLIAPYYPLLLPLLLIGAGQSQIVRCGWWRVLVAGVLVLAFVILTLSPDRPLWPAKTILSRIHAQHPGQRLVNRALKVYTVYSERWDALAGVRALLPPGIKVVGFLGGEDDCDISLWRPFFERRVEHFKLTDSPAEIKARAEYVVVSETSMAEQGVSFDDWLQKTGATRIASTNAMLKINGGVQSWQLVQFSP